MSVYKSTKATPGCHVLLFLPFYMIFSFFSFFLISNAMFVYTMVCRFTKELHCWASSVALQEVDFSSAVDMISKFRGKCHRDVLRYMYHKKFPIKVLQCNFTVKLKLLDIFYGKVCMVMKVHAEEGRFYDI